MRIDIVFPRLPPAIDGIGEHSAILARELQRRGVTVRLVGDLAAADVALLRQRYGLEAVDGWPSGRLRDVGPLVDTIVHGRPDVVLLQFEQFAYGARGFNPAASGIFRALRRRAPGVRRVLFAHENYVYPGSVSHTVMWAYQRWQFLRLVRSANRVLVSTEAWAVRDRLRDAVVVPVFSNIPVAGAVPERRSATAIWFGYLDDARAPYLSAVLRTLRAQAPGRALIYAGKDGERAAALARDLAFEHLTVVPSPPAPELSRLLADARLALAPFPDGVSSRRGSVMAALEHGCTVVTNAGPGTDTVMRRLLDDDAAVAADGVSVAAYEAALIRALDLDDTAAAAVGARGAAAYAARFSPRAAADRLLDALR